MVVFLHQAFNGFGHLCTVQSSILGTCALLSFSFCPINQSSYFDLQLKQSLVCARFQMRQVENLIEQRTSVFPRRAGKHIDCFKNTLEQQ